MGATRRIVAASIVSCAIVGCGGGGGTGVGTSGGSVAFKVQWPSPEGAVVRASAFPDAIPASAIALRLIIAPAASPQDACCIAIKRGSAAFTNRSLVVNDLPAGATTLRFAAFAASNAPNDDVTRTCSTAPADGASACDGSVDAPQSFGADALSFEVAPNEVADAGTINAYSLPFALPLDPGFGLTVAGPRPTIRVAVVDAAATLDSDISVELDTATRTFPVPVVATGAAVECDDGNAGARCSGDGTLDVRGLVFEGTTTEDIEPGNASVIVHASNLATPPRSADVRYPVQVGQQDQAVSCEVTFDTLDAALFGALHFTVDYANAPGNFVPDSTSVDCQILPAVEVSQPNNDLGARFLQIALLSTSGFAGPTDLARCRFEGTRAPVASDFAVNVVDATDPEIVTIHPTPTVRVKTITCGDTTTTIPGTSTSTTIRTTTSISSTTTSSVTSTTTTSSCNVTFRATDASKYGSLQFHVDYTNAPGEFQGTGGNVSCASPISGVIASANDLDASRRLNLGLISISGFQAPIDVETCVFTSTGTLVASDFIIQVDDAAGVDLQPIPAVVQVSSIQCQ